jgi:WD and tetratricopeptide repeats protein 1
VQAAELEKNRADQNGSSKADTHGKLRSLSEILFRPDVGGSSQEGREDSDYDDEMDYETTVSGHESRENDQGVFRGSLSFQFHQREDQTNVHTDENGSVESPRKDDYAFQVFFFPLFLPFLSISNKVHVFNAVGLLHGFSQIVQCSQMLPLI